MTRGRESVEETMTVSVESENVTRGRESVEETMTVSVEAVRMSLEAVRV